MDDGMFDDAIKALMIVAVLIVVLSFAGGCVAGRALW